MTSQTELVELSINHCFTCHAVNPPRASHFTVQFLRYLSDTSGHVVFCCELATYRCITEINLTMEVGITIHSPVEISEEREGSLTITRLLYF